MPALEINEDERIMLDIALMNHRGDLMKEWGQLATNEEIPRWSRDQECKWLDHKIAVTGLLRDRLWKLTAPEGRSDNETDEKTALFNGSVFFKGAVWHRDHGWLYTANQLEAAVNGAQAGGVSEEELDRILRIDRENDQDQMSPGTWTTIPGDFEITFAGPKPFPYWHDMKSQSDGLIERPDGYRLAVCRIRHTREGFKLGFTGAFRDMFRGHFRRYYPDLDSAKTAAEDIFKDGLERQGLALAS